MGGSTTSNAVEELHATDENNRHSNSAIPHGRSWLWTVTAGAAVLVGGVVLLASIWFLRRPLSILFLAVALAAALAPVVAWLERWLPHHVAAILLYVVLALVMLGIALLLIPMIVGQAQRLLDMAPELVDRVQSWFRRRLPVASGQVQDQILTQITGLASTLVALPVQLSSSLIEIVLVVLLSLYALMLAPQAHRLLLRLFPEKHHERVKEISAAVTDAMGGYFRGVAISGVVIAAISYIGLLIIGVDFALVLAIVAGLLEFIPYIGPFIAGALIVVVAFLESPTIAGISLVFMVALQQLEGAVVAPNVMHPQTHISRLATVFVIFAGGSVGGVLGALIGIPLYASIRVIVSWLVLPAIEANQPQTD